MSVRFPFISKSKSAKMVDTGGHKKLPESLHGYVRNLTISYEAATVNISGKLKAHGFYGQESSRAPLYTLIFGLTIHHDDSS